MAESDPFMVAEIGSPVKSRLTMGQRVRKWSIMTIVPLILISGAVYYYVSNDHYVSTDNAYLQQEKISVAAEVGGKIVEVGVKENQKIEAGDLLFRIDPQPFKIAVAQAEASIAAAQVKVVTLETDLNTTGIDIASARENVAFFREEFNRQSTLMERGFTTRARLQAAEHSLSEARSKLANAQGEAEKARAELATGAAAPGVNPGVLAGQAQRDRALFDLSKTEIRAPVGGIISQADRLHVGQMMTQNLPAVSIIANNNSWVEANFKETDLSKMRVGQPVELWFDAYPDMTLKGVIASIGAGTGSEFSILPAQNANGNWVKVTQRVPVRIAITSKPSRPLIAGLSTHVRVDTDK